MTAALENRRLALTARHRLAAGLVALSLLWVALLVAVPYAHTRAPVGRLTASLSASVYALGSSVCHQRSERSFHPWGVRMPVCARCFGLYASAAVGALAGLVGTLLVPTGRKPPISVTAVRWLLVLTALPTAIVWLIEWWGVAQPPAAVRAGFAVPLGAAVGWVVTTAMAREIG